MAFVASSRPPRPVSKMTKSIFVSAKCLSASAVVTSKKVGCGFQSAMRTRMAVRPLATASSEIISPFARMRSKRDEVRGCEQTGAMSVCAQDRIDHGTNRAFAIRPGDVDNFPRSGGFQAVGDLEIALP